MMKKFFGSLFSVLLIFPVSAHARLKVVATTTDLEALVKAVAGPEADVFSLAKGTQDPHQIEAKPSFMVKMRDADLVISQGLELESAWLDPLIQGSRNAKLNQGSRGHFELGPLLDPIEIPGKEVSRAEGDVHRGGNPHFQVDPIRIGKAAVLLSERLGELDPSHAKDFKKRALELQARYEKKTKEWQSRLSKTHITEVVTYHKTLSYFFDRFGIKSTLQLEPKPGIPPTASHLMDVISQIKQRKIKLVLIENYFDMSAADKLRSEIPGLAVVQVPVSVGGEPGLNDLDSLIEKLVKVFESVKP